MGRVGDSAEWILQHGSLAVAIGLCSFLTVLGGAVGQVMWSVGGLSTLAAGAVSIPTVFLGYLLVGRLAPSVEIELVQLDVQNPSDGLIGGFIQVSDGRAELSATVKLPDSRERAELEFREQDFNVGFSNYDEDEVAEVFENRVMIETDQPKVDFRVSIESEGMGGSERQMNIKDRTTNRQIESRDLHFS